GDKVLAILGEVHPLVMANYEMDVRAYAAKIDFDACCALAKAGEKTYKPLPKFPVSTRDLALVCDDEMPVLRLEKAIKAAAGDILESIELFDCYRGAQIPSGKKSLAFALILRSDDHTLNEEELSAAMQKVYDAALKLGCKLRD
ncbi:MAG: phenylalanine--tRNA ligase subunit beta, partial [Oscillospiraceae bacterium]